MNKKPITIAAAVALAAATLAACDDTSTPSAQQQGQKLTEQAYKQQSAAVPYPVTQLRDSLERVKARLDSLPRGSDEYRERYAAFGRMNDSLVALQARTEQRHGELDRARAAFVERSETLRAAIRHWEDSTYQGYDSLTDALAAQRHRQPVTDTTRADGWAHFTLDDGPWWIYGRSWDATDPNAEWYWNVPVTSDTIVLSSRAGRQRPRY